MNTGIESCVRPGGCPAPLEEAVSRLSQIERVALTVFSDSWTQWDAVAGMGGGGRTGLRYSDAKVVAEGYGEDLDSLLLGLVRQCETIVLRLDKERADAQAAQAGVAG